MIAEAKETRAGEVKSQSLHPLFELTAMRIREFLREKEAVFWVFIFPVLMTFALGIAFRNTGTDKTPVAIEASTVSCQIPEAGLQHDSSREAARAAHK